MKQRLVMSAAFLHRPQAVLVDEPMVGLDPRGARLIKDVFRRMADHGVAILMSTHTLEVAQEMCDLVSIILKGRIIAQRHGRRPAAAGGQRRRSADAGVPEAHRRQRPSGDRRDHLMASPAPTSSPRSPICCCRPSGRRATARAAESAATSRARSLFGGVGLAGRLRDLLRRLLGDAAAGGLRRARRLPAPPRAVVAVPDVPLLPRLQRRRHIAVDVLPVGRSAPAARRARSPRAGCSTRASRARSGSRRGWWWSS